MHGLLAQCQDRVHRLGVRVEEAEARAEAAEKQLAEAQARIKHLERLVPEARFLEVAAEALKLSSCGEWREMRGELEAQAAAIRKYREGQ